MTLAGGLIASTAYGSVQAALGASNEPAAGLLALEARQVVETARSVRLTGSVTEVTSTYQVDATLFSNGDCSGTISINDHSARITIVGRWYYIDGSAGLWSEVFGQSAANSRSLSEHWIGVPRSSITGLAANLSMAQLREGFTPSAGATFTELGQSVIGGQRVEGIRRSGRGTLWVAATGHPDPVEFDGTNAGNLLHVRFSGWNMGKPPTAPSGAMRFSGEGGPISLPAG